MSNFTSMSPLLTLGIKKQTWASTEQIQAHRHRRLQRMVKHAYAHIPYYTQLFDEAGVHPDDIQSVEDIQKIPITTRQDIQSLPIEDRIPKGISQDLLNGLTTSGTTGEPLTVLVAPEDTAVNNALSFRALTANGMKPWHRKMSVCGTKDPGQDTSHHGRLGLYRRGWISAYQSPDEWMQALQAFQPHYLMGYCMTLSCMADVVNESKIYQPRLKCIVSTGGFLDDSTRHHIETSFKAPVRDMYASWEGGIMGWECGKCEGYHINADWAIVEILKDGAPAKPGETGEVVITNLHSFGMPFIRYRQGDIAEASSSNPTCKCHLPLLQRVYGRSADIIHLPDGQAISPHLIMRFMGPSPGIKQWQLTQTAPNHCVLDYVQTPAFPIDGEEHLKHGLTAIFKQQITVGINQKSYIPRHPDRKFQIITTYKVSESL